MSAVFVYEIQECLLQFFVAVLYLKENYTNSCIQTHCPKFEAIQRYDFWFAVVVVVVVCSTPEEKCIEVCQKNSSEITSRSSGSISEDNSTSDLGKGGARMWIGFSWIGMRSDCWLCEHNYGLVQSRNLVTTHTAVYPCHSLLKKTPLHCSIGIV